VTVLGFGFTLVAVYRSKTAAQSARDAALEAKALLLRSDAIADFATAVSIMDEIRRLHRVGAWAILPDRYSILRAKLISIRTSNSNMSEDHRVALSRAIEEFKAIEARVERSIASGTAPPNPAKLNEIVGTHLDALGEALTTLKQGIEG